MIYTLENERLRLLVSSVGAEMKSLFNKDGDFEYLWQGNPAYWTGTSPIMFPICGRLPDAKYTYDGKEYEMTTHGFARHSEFALFSQKSDTLTFVLRQNEQTKASYPFDFSFFVSYQLQGVKLTVSFCVQNDDEKELLASFGAHPAFNVPLKSGRFEDYAVEFSEKKNARALDFSERCLCTFHDKLYQENGTKEILLRHSLFDHDAVFLYDTAKTVTLKNTVDSHGVTMHFDDFKYLGLWHKPLSDAPYLCLEPWTSCPSEDKEKEDFEKKPELFRIPVGQSKRASYSVICF